MTDSGNQIINTALKEFNSAKNILEINATYKKYLRLNDVNIEYFCGICKLKFGQKKDGIQHFISVSKDITCKKQTEKYKYWDTASIHAVGDSLFLLLRDYSNGRELSYNSFTASIFNVSYLCLSNNIHNYPETSCDSYFKRAALLQMGAAGTGLLTQGLVQGSLGLSIMKDPLIINDFYSSGKIYYYQYKMPAQGQKLLERARQMHLNLDDLTVDGRHASSYSMEDIARVGQKRHKDIYSVLIKKYAIGEFFLTETEFDSHLNDA